MDKFSLAKPSSFLHCIDLLLRHYIPPFIANLFIDWHPQRNLPLHEQVELQRLISSTIDDCIFIINIKPHILAHIPNKLALLNRILQYLLEDVQSLEAFLEYLPRQIQFHQRPITIRRAVGLPPAGEIVNYLKIAQMHFGKELLSLHSYNYLP